MLEWGKATECSGRGLPLAASVHGAQKALIVYLYPKVYGLRHRQKSPIRSFHNFKICKQFIHGTEIRLLGYDL